MKSITIKEIVDACGGQFIGDEKLLAESVSDVETDSRTLVPGSLFIPIIGENFDGHDFINKAFENGAKVTLTQHDIKSGPYIKVNSTFKALKDIAEYYRSLFDLKLVAVTGSVGKTTTKEMIYSVLAQSFKVLKSQKNYNNEIGVPHTLFELDDSHEIAVIEMGMNHFGEISRLSKTARPDVCVITNIGHSHIGYLESREGIFKAKSEIFDYMKEGGKAILNGDDDLLYTLRTRDFDTIYYGFNEHNDVFLNEFKPKGFESSECAFNEGKKKLTVELNAPGAHMAYAAAAAYCVGKHFKISDAKIRKGISKFEQAGKRMEILKTSKYTVLNDVYNASPESVKAAIDVLTIAEGRRVCILGDMFELGDHAETLHEEVGEYAAHNNIDLLLCVGQLSKKTAEGAKKANLEAKWYESQAHMLAALSGLLQKKDTVLVKASRGMHFEDTVEYIKKI